MASLARIISSLAVGGKKSPFCSAVIVAAGDSKRMGGEDKVFIEICGAPLLAHTLMAFQAVDGVGEIVVVARESCLERVGGICKDYGIDKATRIIAGGPTRMASVTSGVYAASKKADLIAIHDGARPCVSRADIEPALGAAVKFHAAAPGIEVSSTIKRAKGGVIAETIDRDGLFEIQTPQVFAAEIIKAALVNARKKSIEVTDDCQAAELIGAFARITEGSHSNIKVTTIEDLAIAKAILRDRGAADYWREVQ